MFSQSNARKAFNFEGYTLIELLIVLGLLAFLLIVSVPGYRHIQAIIEAKATLYRLMTLLNYARAEAIQTGQQVTICKSSDGKTCSGDWSDGQMIFIGQSVPQILFVAGPIKLGKLSFRGFQSSDFLRFMPNGATFEQNGSFIYHSTQVPKLTWSLIIEKVGRMRLT